MATKKGSIASRWNETPKQIKSDASKKPTKADLARAEAVKRRLKKEGKI